MTQEEILQMFRHRAEGMSVDLLTPNAVIIELAQLLADSRGHLSKENFETLVRIGAVLYKGGRDRFEARSDVDAIMKESAEKRSHE